MPLFCVSALSLTLRSGFSRHCQALRFSPDGSKTNVNAPDCAKTFVPENAGRLGHSGGRAFVTAFSRADDSGRRRSGAANRTENRGVADSHRLGNLATGGAVPSHFHSPLEIEPLSRSAPPDAPCPRLFDASLHPLTNDSPLEFAHARNDAEQHTTCRCAGVYGFLERSEVDSQRLKLSQ